MIPPKWMILKYSEIWKRKKTEKFTLEECAEIMKQNKAVTAVILSNLRKAGWLVVEFDPIDSRKRLYHLKNPEEMIELVQMEA